MIFFSRKVIMVQLKSNIDQLSIREKVVLIALQEKPLATFDEIVSMTKISRSVVFRIVKKLEGPANSIPYFSVKGLPHLDNLELEIVDIIVKADSDKKLQTIKKVCDEHPYITYYSRSYGDVNGMFIQITNPVKCRDLIPILFQKLKHLDFIDDFTIIQSSCKTIHSKIKIEAWDSEYLSWNFSWKDWFEKDIDSTPLTSNPSPKQLEVSIIVKPWLKQRDIAIIGELFWNSRRKKSEMMTKLKTRGWKISPPTFSKQLKIMEKNYISSHRVFIKPKTIALYNSVLIWGYGDEKELQKIKTRMELHSIPFQSTLKIDGYKIFWYLRIPPSQMSDFLYYLRSFLKELHLCYIDFPRGKTYLLNTDAWDEKKQNWITDEDFCINQVLASLKK